MPFGGSLCVTNQWQFYGALFRFQRCKVARLALTPAGFKPSRLFLVASRRLAARDLSR